MIPFGFTDFRNCVKCGNKTVNLYNKFNNPTHNDMYPVTKMVCSHCGAEYHIRWIDDETGKKIPICTDSSNIKNFEDQIIEYSKSKRRNL